MAIAMHTCDLLAIDVRYPNACIMLSMPCCYDVVSCLPCDFLHTDLLRHLRCAKASKRTMHSLNMWDMYEKFCDMHAQFSTSIADNIVFEFNAQACFLDRLATPHIARAGSPTALLGHMPPALRAGQAGECVCVCVFLCVRSALTSQISDLRLSQHATAVPVSGRPRHI
jgi:hypothetical protein